MSSRLPVNILRRATRQIAEASSWWDENRPKAPQAFREEIERALDLLAVQPNIGTRVSDPQVTGVRRIHLSRVHYYLYYRVLPEAVEVIALWHTSRGSGPVL